MGLDCTACEEFVLQQETNEDDWIQTSGTKCGWPHHFQGEDGSYRCGGKEFTFRAGSYSGHYQFRCVLIRFVSSLSWEEFFNLSREERSKYPFYELIDFTDCHGILSGEACAELAKDFDEFHEPIPPYDYWMEQFHNWKKAVNIAKGNGVIVFH